MKIIKLKVPSKLEFQLAEFIFHNATLLISYNASDFFENMLIVIIAIPENKIEDFQNSQFTKYIEK